MLYIKKNAPPKKLAAKIIEIKKSDEWKRAEDDNTSALRSFFDLLDKQGIRDSLVTEQHGLCAYCMKRIKPDEGMTIEHYTPVQGHKESIIDYNNMLGCCKGGSTDAADERRMLCCDAAKGNRELYINPMDKTQMDRIRYRKDGRIYVDSEDKRLQDDIDYVLCLNGKLDKNRKLLYDTSTQIVKGRRDAYRGFEQFMKAIEKKHGKNEERIQILLKKRIREIEGLDEYPEYAGVTLYFLRRRVR